MTEPLPARDRGRALLEGLVAGALCGLVASVVLVVLFFPRTDRWLAACDRRAPFLRVEAFVFPVVHGLLLGAAEALTLRFRSAELAHLWRTVSGGLAPIGAFGACFAVTTVLRGSMPWTELGGPGVPGFGWDNVALLVVTALVTSFSEGIGSGVRPSLVRRRPWLALAQATGFSRSHAPRRRHAGIASVLSVLGLGLVMLLGFIVNSVPRTPLQAAVTITAIGLFQRPARRLARRVLAAIGVTTTQT